ncbi:MAG: endonuclease MutS2 [Hoylesella marshii]|uniref:endonuclease MutS2 n=1 Tax=Hoylesella marshii TaxID=189722 RepID=UPI003FA1324B
MIYPDNFEAKIGFDEIRKLLRERCLSPLGRERVDRMAFSANADTINEWLKQVKEFRLVQQEAGDFPLHGFYDVRESLVRIRLEGTYLEENEVLDLRRSLDAIRQIVQYLNRTDGVEPGDTTPVYPYPALHRMTEGVVTFPLIIQRIDGMLDKYGKIRDDASPELMAVRRELTKAEGSVSRTLTGILRLAQSEGLVEKNVTPTLRDGRLVIPVAPAMKKRIKGIVHDESASGHTVFIEPAEVVEANNRIRELEAEERREIIRILKAFTALVRPHTEEMLTSYRLLARIDLVQAKARWAEATGAWEPQVQARPYIDWTGAIHPLLQQSLHKQGKAVVPLDIALTEAQRILIISGPNAGGKSVCLKTVALLQYMLQCGLSISVGDRSSAGVFESLMIDIGDEQSIENDLSTYSSHLLHMKTMMRQADAHTLLLIDEFGTGTEPQIGGAIAEAVLRQFCKKHAFGVITTHYQNLKHFADAHKGVVNAAMLYDRKEMKALFQLQIGRPGSSFAIEIARKTGIPEEVIAEASELVGSDYIQSDKYLQDIVRDKRYWENKRQNIHRHEKQMEKVIERYEYNVAEIEKSRREILQKAKEQAEELLQESNRKIENAIRAIREAQAEKEETRRIREGLQAFRDEVQTFDSMANDEKIARKMEQIRQRKERREQRKREKTMQGDSERIVSRGTEKVENKAEFLCVGDAVRMKGTSTQGTVEALEGGSVTVIFGGMRTRMKADRLEKLSAPLAEVQPSVRTEGRMTCRTIDDRTKNFKQDLDVRGMRGDEALHAVMHFIDDAILVGVPRVRILHGKGNGILRQLIRQYLSSVPNITAYRDEHVQFGGAGITVADIG